MHGDLYSFNDQEGYESIVDKFHNYIFDCWKFGFKTKKIIDSCDIAITEEDVKVAFKKVVNYHLLK